MAVDGVRSVYIETYNFGSTAAFWQSLGFEHFLDLGEVSGGFRAADGGTYLFIEEVGEDHPLATAPIFNLTPGGAADLPSDLNVLRPLEDTHWGSRQMVVRDPDGRPWTLEDAGERFPNYS